MTPGTSLAAWIAAASAVVYVAIFVLLRLVPVRRQPTPNDPLGGDWRLGP